MKQFVIMLLCLSSMALVLGQSTKDEAEIKALVEKEVKAYLSHDFDTWATCWVQNNHAHHYYTSQNYHQGLDGWEMMQEAFKKEFSIEAPKDYFIEKSDYKFLIKGDLAFATIKEMYVSKTGENPSVWHANNSATFERVEGEWKIVGYDIINKSTFSASDYDVVGQLNSLGSMLLEMNREDDALKVFNLCTDLNEEDECLKYNRLGDFFMARGSKDIAADYYNRCIKSDPKNEHALKQLKKLGMK